ncbi:MAG: trigger factor [Spirochaetes bacterium]|nr:trigger factor [Spirochaetota bacterium]
MTHQHPEEKPLALTVKQTPAEKRQVKLEIEIAYAELEREYASTRAEASREIALPGFRKGKVPVAALEKRYRDSFRAQAIENILPKAYEQALKELDLKAYGRGMAEKIGEWEEQKPLSVTFLVTLQPTCELKDFAGVAVKEPVIEITEADIDGEVKTYLRSKMELVPTEEAVGGAHWVKVDLTYDDEALAAQNLKGSPVMTERLGDRPQAFGMEDVRGMKAGETRKIEKSYPEDFPVKELAGKKAGATLAVHEVKLVKIPEISEELAKEFQFESVADMRAKLRAQVEQFAERHREREIRRQALEALAARAKIEIPDAMTHDVAHYFLEQHLRRMGFGDKEIPHLLHSPHESIKKLHEDYMAQAVTNLTEDLLMEALRKLETVEVTDEAMNAEIEKRALDQKIDAKELRKNMLKSGEFTELKKRLADRGLIERVIAKGKKTPGEKVPLSKLFS